MSLAIGPPSLVTSSATPINTGVLQSQLTRYEIQLADWCACPSGKTPAGKEKIAEIQAKADATRAQLQLADTARTQASAASAATPAVQSAQAPQRLIDVVV